MRGQHQSSQRRLNRHWQSGKKKSEKFYFVGNDTEYGSFGSWTEFYDSETYGRNWMVGGTGPVDNKQHFINHTFADVWHRVYRMRVGEHMLVHINLHKPSLSTYPDNYPNWVPPVLNLTYEIGDNSTYFWLTQPLRNNYNFPGIVYDYFNPSVSSFVIDYTMRQNNITDYTQEYININWFFNYIFGDISAIPMQYVTMERVRFYEWSYIDGYVEFI